MLEVEGISYSYPETEPVLKDVSFEVAYEPLAFQKPESPGGAEIIFASREDYPKENPLCDLPPEEREAELIARRIVRLLSQEEPEAFQAGDIALLLRTRGNLKSYEEALFRHHIPFLTIGGIGFYERQEIYDLANFLQFLVTPDHDPALLGLLRSPFLEVSDHLIFRVAKNEGRSLWERLLAFDKMGDVLTKTEA